MALGRDKDDRRPTNVNEVNALLGKGSEFEGKLTFEGTVRIDGLFAGQIFTEDVLIVGEGAVVKAEIDVGSIIVSGQVIGNVRARNSVEIHAPGKLRGNVVTPNLQVDRGVIFEGSCQMENIEEKLRQRPPGSGKQADIPKKKDAPVATA